MVAAMDGSGENRSINIHSNDDKSRPGTDPLQPALSRPSPDLRQHDAEAEVRSCEPHTVNSDESFSKESPVVVDVQATVVRPPAHLPQPEAPPGLADPVPAAAMARSATTNGRTEAKEDGPGGDPVMERSVSVGAGRSSSGGGIGKYIRERGSALARRFSMGDVADDKGGGKMHPPAAAVTEFELSGVRVIVRVKDEHEGEGPGEEAVKSTNEQEARAQAKAMILRQPDVPHSQTGRGRITFFSRSSCRDCGAVRSFFRSQLLPYVEINVDVFPSRLKELSRRTGGSTSVPQIFFNGRLLGGLVALNSLRNSGEFERRLRDMMALEDEEEAAPEPPVFGLDDDDEEDEVDSMASIARAMRERVVLSDRIARMKLVRGCFTGSELVEAVIEHLDCGRKKAVEVGNELERKHLLHHVFRDQGGFQDSATHLYRFLDQDPAVYTCYNMGLGVSYREVRPASWLARKLTALMQAILEAYASDDARKVDYNRISASEEFRRYVKVAQELQRVDVFAMSPDDRLAFFLNLYNAMVIHAVICVGRPEGPAGVIDRWAYYGNFHYMVGGYPYSLSTIKDGILRANRRQPYSISRSLPAADKRLELAPTKLNPLIHFGLCNSTRSSPPVRFFSPQTVEADLRNAARDFFSSGGIQVDLDKRTVHLTRIIKWYSADFGPEKQDILNWILNFLDATRAGLLTHLLSDGGPVNIVYQDFDWSLNI